MSLAMNLLKTLCRQESNRLLPRYSTEGFAILRRNLALIVPAIAFVVALVPAITLLAQGPGSAGRSKTKPQASREASGTLPARNKKTDAAPKVGQFSSKNFVVHTDLAADEAQALLKRLETMVGLISKYWGRPLSGVIEMYVVDDLRNWPEGMLPPEGRAGIERGGGLTTTQVLTRGNAFHAKAVVYAVADRGTPQHEAVHAYCGQTFGRTGPVWYSEGMAEMGQYWRTDDRGVNAHDVVIRYLRSSPIKPLDEIVNGEEWSGDSWQNYAWRWALCHLLANNPNYSSRFRPLGLGLLTNQEVSFENTYGDMAKEIVFEYREFVSQLERGYRVDLCAWDWKARFKPVKTQNITTCRVDAAKGWQPSRLTVAKGETYEFSAAGSWTTSPQGEATNADGSGGGPGRLMGVVLRDEPREYSLGEPFELGAFGTFTAPADGNIYLRCRDEWHALSDNKGSMTVKLKMQGKGKPLLPPQEDGEKTRMSRTENSDK